MQRIQDVLEQVTTARSYTQDMLNHIDPSLWFLQPATYDQPAENTSPARGVTHVAWQVGHLAVAQYGLALMRVRGEQPSDTELMPAAFRQAFGKGSVPQADPADNPPIDEIRSVFDKVYERVLAELPGLPDSVFDELADGSPHPMFKSKLGAVLFSAQHEFVHVGQIALIRRLLGQASLR